MKKRLILFVGAILAGLFMAGCSDGSAPKLSSREKALFETSTPEIKRLFEAALAADQADNYLSASTNYYALLRQNLSSDQAMAMQTAMVSLKERVFEAADKGDAGAKAAVEYYKANSAR